VENLCKSPGGAEYNEFAWYHPILDDARKCSYQLLRMAIIDCNEREAFVIIHRKMKVLLEAQIIIIMINNDNK